MSVNGQDEDNQELAGRESAGRKSAGRKLAGRKLAGRKLAGRELAGRELAGRELARIPDYELDEMLVVTAPEQVRALADPLRRTLLELLNERAATVTEMALAVARPKSTIAYHVNLLLDVGLVRVIRTRRVRAIDERYYGRVARTLYLGVLTSAEDVQVASAINGVAEAAAESAPAHAADQLRCTLVHARIPIEEVRNFWAEVQALARRFAQIPRAGDQVYGFVAGLYPTDAPTLPDATLPDATQPCATQPDATGDPAEA